MSSEETSPHQNASAEQDVPAGGPPASGSPGQPLSPPRAGVWAMGGAGLLAGLLGWLLLESSFPFFHVPDEALQRIPLSFAPEELLVEFAAVKQAVNLKNGVAAGALLGALAAGAFAVAQGVLGRGRRAYLAMTLCLVCGSLAGAAGGLVGQAGLAGQIRLDRLLGSTESMTTTVVFQAAFWAMLGAGTGAGTGWFSGSARRLLGLLGQGLLAGAVFGLVYAAGAALAFPADDAGQLVPASPANRALWTMAAATMIGLLLGTASDRRRGRPGAS